MISWNIYFKDEPETDVDNRDGKAHSSDDKSRPPKKKSRSRSTTSSDKPKHESATKAGKARSHRDNDVGKLAKLLEMPMDIFSEIATHLEPLDLLQLARSTRGMNQVLMSRNSRPIWRAARSSKGFPDCPPDLSEPELARLLFEKDCLVCFAPRATKVDWIWRFRLCKHCEPVYFVKASTLLEEIPDLTEDLLRCIPCSRSHITDNALKKVFSVRVHAFVAKYRAAVPNGLPAGEAAIRREAFINKHKELVPLVLAHARTIEDWVRSLKARKRQEDVETASRRSSEIRRRLIELGYSESDFPVGPKSHVWHRLVHQPRDLTPQIWDKLRGKLEVCIKFNVAFREEVEQLSRRRERLSELGGYVAQLGKDREKRNEQLYMHQGDAWGLPAVQALLDDVNVPVTDERWNEAKEQVEKEMDQFAENVRTHLITEVIGRKDAGTLLRTAVAAPSPEIDVAFLCAPTTFFQCIICKMSMCHYPEMLTHVHGWSTPWKKENFRFNVATTELAEAVLASLPKHLNRPSWGAGEGRVYQCLRCGHADFDFGNLVKHFQENQFESHGMQELSVLYRRSSYLHDLKVDSPLATIVSAGEAYGGKRPEGKIVGSTPIPNLVDRDNEGTVLQSAMDASRRILMSDGWRV